MRTFKLINILRGRIRDLEFERQASGLKNDPIYDAKVYELDRVLRWLEMDMKKKGKEAA